MPDPVMTAATDQTTPLAPAAVNQTADSTAPAPPEVSAQPVPPPNPALDSGQKPTPPAPYGNAPGTAVPKQTFREGMAAQGPPAYHTDSSGNVISNTPVRAPSVKGVLGQILMGALEGASRGAGAETSTEGNPNFTAGASASAKARIAADDKARAVAQRNFENNQAATAAKVKTQMELAQTAQITQNMSFAADEHPGVLRAQSLEHEEAELRIRGLHQKLLEDGIDFRKNMAAIGVDPAAFTEHSPELTAQVKPLVAGASRAVHNGQAGDANGVDIYPKAALAAPITTPVTYNTYDGALDKDGVPVPTQHVITPDGKTTANDYLDKYFAGQAQLTRLAQQVHADMTMKEQKANIAKLGAEANKDNAAAEQTRKQTEMMGSYAPPPGFQPNPNVFSMNLPDIQKDLVQKGVQIPPDLPSIWALAHYKVGPDSFPVTLRKGVPQTSRTAAQNYALQYLNPGYDEKNYAAVKKMETEFANPDAGHAGGNLIAFNTATAHLGQLYDAAKALQTGDIQVLNKMAQYYGVQTGQSPVLTFNAIRGALAGEIGKTFKGSAADIPEREGIEKSINAANSPQQAQDVAKTYAHLMLSKVGSTVAHYTAYTGELPPEAIQPAAAGVFERMGIDPNSVLPTNAKVSVGGTGNANPQQPAAQAPKPFVNRAGQSFVPDANGQFTANGWVWQVSKNANGDYVGAKAVKPAQ